MSLPPILGICGSAGSGKDTLAAAICAASPLTPEGHATAVQISLADGMKRLTADLFGFGPKRLWGPSEERNQTRKLGGAEVDADYQGSMLWKAQYRTRLSEFGVTKQEDIESFYRWISEFAPGTESSARRILQTLGTEFGRAVSDTLWVDYTIGIARKLLGGGYTYTRQNGLIKSPASYYNCVIIADTRFRNEVLAINREGGCVVLVERDAPNDLGTNATHRSETEMATIPLSWYRSIAYNNGTLQDLTAPHTIRAIVRGAPSVYTKTGY